MKHILFVSAALSAFFTLFMMSCGSTQVAEPAPVVAEPEPEPPVAEPAPVAAPKPAEKTAEDLEYERSIGNAGVSRNTFEDDKAAILRIINELSTVMKTLNYKAWVTYLDKDTIDYWSRPVNLRKAQARLPIKGLQLKTLEDYFRYVFVPARNGREVTEIRYVSPTYVKAVQVTKEDKDIVYYYFNKINGKWMVNIPPLND